MISGSMVILGLVAAGMLLVHAGWRWRRISAALTLGYLDQAIRLNVPIERVLAAAAAGHAWLWRSRLLRLNRRLENGATLGGALRSAVHTLDSRTTAMIEVAQRTGQTGPMIRRLNDQAARFDPLRQSDRWVYPTIALWAVLVAMTRAYGTTTLGAISIYTQVLSKMEMEIPASFTGLKQLGPVIHDLSAVLFYGGGVLVILGGIWVTLGGWKNQGVTRWITDSILWWLPVFGSMERDRGMADACGLLADATAGGMPLPAALRDCELLRVNRILGRRLRRMAVTIESGSPAGIAAAQARLPGLMSAALSQSDVPAAIRFLERHYDGRYQMTYEWIASILGPAITLAMGLAVGWLVLTLYLPLLQLADAAAFGPATRGLPGATP